MADSSTERKTEKKGKTEKWIVSSVYNDKNSGRTFERVTPSG